MKTLANIVSADELSSVASRYFTSGVKPYLIFLHSLLLFTLCRPWKTYSIDNS